MKRSAAKWSVRLRIARLRAVLFAFLCVACAWLGERSEPTCIKTSTRHGAEVSYFGYFLFLVST